MGTVDLVELRTGVEQYGELVARAGVDRVKESLDLTVPRATGELAESWFHDDGGLVHSIDYTVEWARYQDEGTGGHTIEGDPLLSFFWPQVGRTVVLRSVWHPGSTMHVGWFSDEVSEPAWEAACQAGVADVGPYQA